MILVFLKKEVKKLMKEVKVEHPELLRTADLLHSNIKRLQFKTSYIFVGWLNNTTMDVKKLYFRNSDNKEYLKLITRRW